MDCRKELVGLWMAEAEGAKFWLNVLTNLTNQVVPARAARGMRRRD